MATLTPGKIFFSTTPTVLVENALDVGRHVFRLVVVDNSGNASTPVDLVISVEKPAPPPDTTTPPTRATTIDPAVLRAATTINPAILRAATVVEKAPVAPPPKVEVAEPIKPATVLKPTLINPTLLRPIKPK